MSDEPETPEVMSHEDWSEFLQWSGLTQRLDLVLETWVGNLSKSARRSLGENDTNVLYDMVQAVIADAARQVESGRVVEFWATHGIDWPPKVAP
jgi:hypothetical protein